MRASRFAVVGFVVIGLVLGVAITLNWDALMPQANAAGGVVEDPNQVAPDRYVYYPGTEVLKPGEMRVVCCGSGLPAARLGQAATCFMVELDNGEKFLFDIGSGAMWEPSTRSSTS